MQRLKERGDTRDRGPFAFVPFVEHALQSGSRVLWRHGAIPFRLPSLHRHEPMLRELVQRVVDLRIRNARAGDEVPRRRVREADEGGERLRGVSGKAEVPEGAFNLLAGTVRGCVSDRFQPCPVYTS